MPASYSQAWCSTPPSPPPRPQQWLPQRRCHSYLNSFMQICRLSSYLRNMTTATAEKKCKSVRLKRGLEKCFPSPEPCHNSAVEIATRIPDLPATQPCADTCSDPPGATDISRGETFATPCKRYLIYHFLNNWLCQKLVAYKIFEYEFSNSFMQNIFCWSIMEWTYIWLEQV